MTTNVNFDDLARKSFEPNATSNDYENLFGAVFSLDAWYFIADAEFSYKLPYCSPFPNLFGDAPALTVFTDGERARKFIAEGGLKGGAAVSDPPENLILEISTADILNFLDQLAPLGIIKIFFNPNTDSHGFHHDLKMMRPIYEHLESKNLISGNEFEPENVSLPVEENFIRQENEIENSGDADFDALSRQANEPNAPMENLNALFGAAFALENWEFIARGEMPNVNPYIAARADVADGQQMVRAFTDGERLQRFAGENNLTLEDDSVDVLSIPTEGIIEYLEQFMDYGVHGVWFNSDSISDGFFVPIKQLRPIKEHLAKLNILTAQTVETILINVKDGLSFPSGFVSQAEYACNFYVRVPSDWLDGEKLKEEKLEKIYEKVYGETWRSGNSDGSHYVVLESSTKIFAPDELKTTNFGELKTTNENQYWFFVADENGEFKSVSENGFQSYIDEEIQTARTNEARQQQDNLANLGMSATADGGFEQNLTINKIGAVNFRAAIAPFYEAIVPLLKDYQGTGDFVTLLRFEAEGKSEQVENIAENAHGAYLQIRRFLYLNPKNGVRIGVNSIHGSYLRHVESNAELLVSIELCKNLDNQTAAFYHAFQGPTTEVLNLSAAIQPILESVGYQPVQ